MKPVRLQLSRKKGFNLQAASRKLNGLPAVNCARPSIWGNPFVVGSFQDIDEGNFRRVGKINQEYAVQLFRRLIDTGRVPPFLEKTIRTELRGKNLACWCRTSSVCHCDVLLELANT